MPFVRKYIFIIKSLHANVRWAFFVRVKYQIAPLKDVVEVNPHACTTIVQKDNSNKKKHAGKIISVILSKYIVPYSYVHMFNMSTLFR